MKKGFASISDHIHPSHLSRFSDLVGIGTATPICAMSRLPGFIGPVPPPLLIRRISPYMLFVCIFVDTNRIIFHLKKRCQWKIKGKVQGDLPA
jgi:hypothetical protein